MYRMLNVFTLTTLLFVSAAAHAQDPIQDLLDELSAYEYGDVRIPLREAQLWVTNALGSEDDSAAVAASLATLLERDSTLDCKQFVCRQLARIGNADQVPALARLLNDASTADLARIALQAIPGPEADAALIAALETTSGDVRIGVINSLGERRAKDAVGPLRKLAKDGSEPAIAALGKIGTANARRALGSAKRGASTELKLAIDDAIRVCAETRKADRAS